MSDSPGAWALGFAVVGTIGLFAEFVAVIVLLSYVAIFACCIYAAIVLHWVMKNPIAKFRWWLTFFFTSFTIVAIPLLLGFMIAPGGNAEAQGAAGAAQGLGMMFVGVLLIVAYASIPLLYEWCNSESRVEKSRRPEATVTYQHRRTSPRPRASTPIEDNDSILVEVDLTSSLAEVLSRFKITAPRDFLEREGDRTFSGSELACVRVFRPTEDVAALSDQLAKHWLRPATLPELLALAPKLDKTKGPAAIVCLGSSFVYHSRERFPVLYSDDRGLRIELVQAHSIPWFADCCVLATHL